MSRKPGAIQATSSSRWRCMQAIAAQSCISQEILEKEFKVIHERHGTSEYAFSIEELRQETALGDRARLVCQEPCQDQGSICSGTLCTDIDLDEQHCGSCSAQPCPAGTCCFMGFCAPCDFGGLNGVVPAGGELVDCQISDHPAIEVSSHVISFCEPPGNPSCVLGEQGGDEELCTRDRLHRT